MTPAEVRGEYLNIASARLSRGGERTSRLNRKVKGRKGIGKFAGLTLANVMSVSTAARGVRCTVTLNKEAVLASRGDLETVPLPFEEGSAAADEHGTIVTLSELDQKLNFPTPDRLRELLVLEYGREDSFKVFVNDAPLTVDDVPGETHVVETELPSVGAVKLHFTVADRKTQPKSPGIVVRIDGKAVGKPLLFELDNDPEIPTKLARKLVGVIDVSGADHAVTADWGSLIENSKVYEEIKELTAREAKAGLEASHSREINLQKARIKAEIDRRLAKLPEHRRHYANLAMNKLLRRFYDESDDRIGTIAEVALDAMEHDDYWTVLESIGEASKRDVGEFATSLEQFGLLELASIARQSEARRSFLDYLSELVRNPKTLEAQCHTALEANLWVLGRAYSMISSNAALRGIVERYLNQRYKGSRASKRPDLLLSEDISGRYLLVEFKRPSHIIQRDDINQAEKYRDDLSPFLSMQNGIDIRLFGGSRSQNINSQNVAPGIEVGTYMSLIATARSEIDWLLAVLAK